MKTRFINVDRDSPMLLPPDLRDWIAADDPVHFIIEAVQQTPTEVFRGNGRGSGSAQYPPAMMLALLIYCYSMGIFSSRRIEWELLTLSYNIKRIWNMKMAKAPA